MTLYVLPKTNILWQISQKNTDHLMGIIIHWDTTRASINSYFLQSIIDILAFLDNMLIQYMPLLLKETRKQHRMSLKFQTQTRLLAEFILMYLLGRTENLKILTSLVDFLLLL